jgi:hypothetical protein
MDPLRFGAGEAEAFHPLVKLRKHTSYQHLQLAFPITIGKREAGSGKREAGTGLGSFQLRWRRGDFFVGPGVEPAS